MGKSEFETWFAAQYGKRPCGSMTFGQLADRIADAQIAVSKAQDAYDAAAKYDAQLDAALVAWQASRNPKPKAWRKK